MATLAAVLLATAPAPAKGPTVECVDAGGNGCAFTTIQAAIDAAPLKGTTVIDVHAGTYVEQVQIPAKLAVTIAGAGIGQTIVDGSGPPGTPTITNPS